MEQQNEKIFKSKQYWEMRYVNGGNCGLGSFGKLGKYKAKIINDFVTINEIKNVIDFGCGDGIQLELLNIPKYIGYEVSKKAIKICKSKFKKDNSKSFFIMNKYKNETVELTLSLDVIYHLTENKVFENYMEKLFNSSNKFVIIFSSNYFSDVYESPHIKSRKFTDYVEKNFKCFELFKKLQKQPGTSANFFYYRKKINNGTSAK